MERQSQSVTTSLLPRQLQVVMVRASHRIEVSSLGLAHATAEEVKVTIEIRVTVCGEERTLSLRRSQVDLHE